MLLICGPCDLPPVKTAVLVTLLLGLAGCTATPPPVSEPSGPLFSDGEQAGDPGTKSEGGKGGIVGVLVDPAIRPIANATVSLQGRDGNRTTAEDGSFSFLGLNPGAYVVNAALVGYLPQQAPVEVQAGQLTQVRVMLQPEVVPEPFNVTLKFEGFAQATFPGSDVATVLFLLELIGGPETCERCRFTVPNDDRLKALVIEATMADNGAGSNGFGLYFEHGGTFAGGYFQAPNPATYVHSFEEPVAAGSSQLTFFPYSEPAPELNKQFQVFVTLFYEADPPEGFTVLDDE